MKISAPILGILLGFLPAACVLAQANSSLATPGPQAASLPTTRSPVPRLQQLLAAGEYVQAFELAVANRDDWEGDMQFDFLYGMAAIESGNPNEAVFAFERVANSAPSATERGRARLELARAYYLTNNLTAAETLFNRVLESNPPQNVRENIQAFLVLIDANQRRQQASFTWSVSANAGYDDNINSATADSLVETPLIGQVELNPDGLKTADEFADLSVNMLYRRFITRDRVVDFNLNLNRRDNFSTDQFDLDNLRGDLSYSHGDQRHRFRYSLQANKLRLDGSDFQQSTGLAVSWQRAGSNGWYQSLSGSLSAIRYDTESSANNDLRDVDQRLISLGLTRLSSNLTNSTSFYYADEEAQESRGEHNGRSFYGIAHSLSWRLNSAHTPYVRVNLQKLDYDDRHPVFFQTTRSDTVTSASLGWMWQFNRRLVVSSELSYTDADSNIDLFTYSRSRAQAGLRYQF